MNKFVFWDFDGTLVKSTSWRGSLMAALDECEPGHHIDQEQLRPFLRDGFPWHRPDEPHPHLCAPDAWWKSLEPLFIWAFSGVGFNNERARHLAGRVRRYTTDPVKYVLYQDTVEVLTRLKEKGWKHIILSNHIPELPDIVKALGLYALVEACISSALTGYEKPHPQAFRLALLAAGNPDVVWMVGDNLDSDVSGAERSGIPAILVHAPDVLGARYSAPQLVDIMSFLPNE